MIIIFLDIDGVLARLLNNRYQDPVGIFDRDAIACLHKLIADIEKTGETVGIVISSNWRQDQSVPQLRETFKRFSFSTRIIGKTSDIPKVWTDSSRGARIQEWMQEHQLCGITNFVVFDDNAFDIANKLKSKFVQCNQGALSAADAALALNIVTNVPMPSNLINAETASSVPQCVKAQAVSLAQNEQLAALKTLICNHFKKLVSQEKDDCCQQLEDWSKQQNNKTAAILQTELKGNDLCSAAKRGELDKVKKLLTASPELLNYRDNFNATALTWATVRGHSHLAIYLIQAGAIVDNPSTPCNRLPIHHAVQSGRIDIVQTLLEKYPLLLNKRDSHNKTPLLLAVKGRDINMVRYLLSKGPDLEVAQYPEENDPSHNCTALDWAVQNDCKDIALLLTQAGAILSEPSRAMVIQKQATAPSWAVFFPKPPPQTSKKYIDSPSAIINLGKTGFSRRDAHFS
jgi:hypothetical protein